MSNDEDAVKLFVVIYDQGVGFKHWALFVDDREKFIVLHAIGSEGRFRFEERKSNARESKRDPELVELATIDKDQIPRLRRAARRQPLNRGPGWNCQDFVLELVQEAIDNGMIEVDDEKVKEIRGKMDGFE
ncbi:hypothetical protein FH972_021163 [Carpinus fangiana]|uniref:Uncharacterized protein n=1 Tax=Carpinus fangiana TaxID=176857 RepID=A0A5N6KP36_9ROSI|nr:hypothetical protein FH972_021163 [Carpinus fangiana]